MEVFWSFQECEGMPRLEVVRSRHVERQRKTKIEGRADFAMHGLTHREKYTRKELVKYLLIGILIILRLMTNLGLEKGVRKAR